MISWNMLSSMIPYHIHLGVAQPMQKPKEESWAIFFVPWEQIP